MSFVKKMWRPLVALLFLIILVKKGPIKVEQVQLVLAEPQILFIGLTFFLLQLVLFSYRWKVFVDQLSILKFKTAFKLNAIGLFFSFFIPGGVGGDVIKALELSKDHVTSKSTALATVIADRVLGLYSMIFFSAVFLSFEFFLSPTAQIKNYLLISLTLLAGLSVGLWLAPYFIQKINEHFRQKQNRFIGHLNKILLSLNLTFASFRKPKLMLINLVYCFFVQIISIYFMYFVVKYLKVQPPPFFIFFSLCCFGILASAIPLTPAGIGVGQAAFYFLFSPYGVDVAEASVTAVSLFQLFQLFFALIGGLFFAFKKTPPAFEKVSKNNTEDVYEK